MASDSTGQVVFDAKNKSDLTHEEIWDDTLLIQQYDEAMQRARQKLQKRNSTNNNTTESEQSDVVRAEGVNDTSSQPNLNAKKKKKKKKPVKKTDWHTGDYCRAKFSGDGMFYEAVLLGTNSTSNKCTVRYLGYNNEEEVCINKLVKSKGPSARQRQEEEAGDVQSESDLGSSVAESDMQSDTEGDRLGKRHRPGSYCGMMPPPDFHSNGPPMVPPPHLPDLPPPPALALDPRSDDPQTCEALHTMLMSWYMTGYHTGYYQGLRHSQMRKPKRK